MRLGRSLLFMKVDVTTFIHSSIAIKLCSMKQLAKKSKWSCHEKRINPLLTAVNFIRSGVVSAVVVAITDKGCTDATSIATGELSSWVTCGKGAALLVTVVTTVVCIVAGVA